MQKKIGTFTKIFFFACLLLITNVSQTNTTLAAGCGYTGTSCYSQCYPYGGICAGSGNNEHCNCYQQLTCDPNDCSADCSNGSYCNSRDECKCFLPPIGDAALGNRFDLTGLSVNFFKITFPFAVIFGFINIISAGYALMTSEGDPRRVNEGKEKLQAAILGLLYVLLIIGILRIILGTLIAGTSVSF